MPFGALRVRAIVSAIGLSVAVVTTVSVPAGYAIVEYLAQATALSFKAELNAARVAKYAYAHDLWRFHRVRIEELIELPLHRGEAIAQKVLETDGSESPRWTSA